MSCIVVFIVYCFLLRETIIICISYIKSVLIPYFCYFGTQGHSIVSLSVTVSPHTDLWVINCTGIYVEVGTAWQVLQLNRKKGLVRCCTCVDVDAAWGQVVRSNDLICVHRLLLMRAVGRQVTILLSFLTSNPFFFLKPRPTGQKGKMWWIGGCSFHEYRLLSLEFWCFWSNVM